MDFGVVRDRLKVFGVSAAKETAVAVTSDYGAKGDGKTDDTVAIQKALDSGAGVVYFPAADYMVTTNDGPHTVDNVTMMTNLGVGLKVRSNTTLFFESGGVLKAIANDKFSYTMLNLTNVSNVNICGGELIGDRDNHQITYTTNRAGSNRYAGETGWGILMVGATNVAIYGTKISKMWGDAIDLFASNDAGAKTNSYITIKNAVLDNNRRQGISMESADGVLIDNMVISNTGGTAPGAAIDIEPANFADPKLRAVRNVTIKHTFTLNNDNAGVLLYGMSQAADGWSAGGAVIDNIKIDHVTFDGNNTNNFNIQDKGGWELAFNGNLAIVGASNVSVKQAKLIHANPAGHLVDDNPNRIYPANSQPNAGIYIGYSQGITITDSYLDNMDVIIAGPRSTQFAYANSSATVTNTLARQVYIDDATPAATVTKSGNRYYPSVSNQSRYGRQIGLWRSSKIINNHGKSIGQIINNRGKTVWRKRAAPTNQVVFDGNAFPSSLVVTTPATNTTTINLTADVTGKALAFDVAFSSNREVDSLSNINAYIQGFNAVFALAHPGLDWQLSLPAGATQTNPISDVALRFGWNSWGGSYQWSSDVVKKMDLSQSIKVTRLSGTQIQLTTPVLDASSEGGRGLIWINVTKVYILVGG
ncbi:glycosyl hydrolase family 28-related protein [Lacticaseibacillus saniviri]